MIPLNPPTPYTRMCLPDDLAHMGDLTQGQVGFPAATVANRKAVGNDATDGLPLPGDSPPAGGYDAPTWGKRLYPSTADQGTSLSAGRVL